jgi:hypothetical protein
MMSYDLVGTLWSSALLEHVSVDVMDILRSKTRPMDSVDLLIDPLTVLLTDNLPIFVG